MRRAAGDGLKRGYFTVLFRRLMGERVLTSTNHEGTIAEGKEARRRQNGGVLNSPVRGGARGGPRECGMLAEKTRGEPEEGSNIDWDFQGVRLVQRVKRV